MNASSTKVANAAANVAAGATNLVTGIIPGTDSGKGAMIFGLVVLVVALGISLMIYMWVIKPNADKLPTQQNMVNIAAAQTTAIEAALGAVTMKKEPMKTLGNDRNFLINHHVLATIGSGYLGPVRDGVFSEQQAIKLAISSGVRCFVFDIFEDKNGAARMKNSVNGVKVSLNNGHLGKALCSTDQVAFGSMLGATQNFMENDPVIYYLRFEKPPSPKAAQEIADAFYRIRGSVLRSNSKGEFTHRKSEGQLFFLNPEDLSKKIIVLTNIDTGVYHKGISTTSRPDLDYYVHGRVYKITDNQKDVNTRYAYEIPLSYVSDLDDEGVQDLVKKTRVAWSIVIPPSTEYIYTDDDIKKINACGIQAVATYALRDVVLDAAGSNMKDGKVKRIPVLNMFRTRGSQGAYVAKKEEQQYVRPKPAPIEAAPKEFNSNGGMLVTPSMPN
jgi:hypothetical protein